MIKPVLLIVVIHALFTKSVKCFTEWFDGEKLGYIYLMLGMLLTVVYLFLFKDVLNYTVLIPILLVLTMLNITFDKLIDYIKYVKYK